MKVTDKITFGKYKGRTFEEISEIDASYILWLKKECKIKFPKEFLVAVEMDLRREPLEASQWEYIDDDPMNEQFFGQG